MNVVSKNVYLNVLDGIKHKNIVWFRKTGSQKNMEDVDWKISNTSGLLKKTDYNTKIKEIENKMYIATEATKTTKGTLNKKVPETESKIFSITNLATKALLNTKATENKIVNIWYTKCRIPQVFLLALSLLDKQKKILTQEWNKKWKVLQKSNGNCS